MAGMKRFVTYIYGYEEKEKGANVGFAKIEVRGEECRIEIHLRGVYSGGGLFRAYLFQAKQGEIVGFSLGEMKVINNNGDFGTIIKAGSIGDSPHGIYDMDGLCLLDEEERMFLSRWKEGIALEVSRENFKTWEPPQFTMEEEKEHLKEKEQLEEKQQDLATELSIQEKQPRHSQEIQQEDTIAATAIPLRNVFPKYDWLTIWEQLKRDHPVVTPFDDKEVLCIQIELKDLRELPKRYWYLGNNSFLLHGFFNYRYLLIGNIDKERWLIGIPGIYQHQERVMAAIFGFPEFLPVTMEEVENDSEPLNRFGYWYRFIEE